MAWLTDPQADGAQIGGWRHPRKKLAQPLKGIGLKVLEQGIHGPNIIGVEAMSPALCLMRDAGGVQTAGIRVVRRKTNKASWENPKAGVASRSYNPL